MTLYPIYPFKLANPRVNWSGHTLSGWAGSRLFLFDDDWHAFRFLHGKHRLPYKTIRSSFQALLGCVNQGVNDEPGCRFLLLCASFAHLLCEFCCFYHARMIQQDFQKYLTSSLYNPDK